MRHTVESLLEQLDKQQGLELDQLPVGTIIEVQTQNTLYTFKLTGQGKALVEGGSRFPTPSQVIVAGSTFGGSLIKVRYMAVGMYIELHRISSNKFLLLSQTKSIKVKSTDGSWEYTLK